MVLNKAPPQLFSEKTKSKTSRSRVVNNGRNDAAAEDALKAGADGGGTPRREEE